MSWPQILICWGGVCVLFVIWNRAFWNWLGKDDDSTSHHH